MWGFIVICYMYESFKDNIDSYVCGLYLYKCMWIIKVGMLHTFFYLVGCMYMYVCEF